MKRRYVKIDETNRVFKSYSECDKFLGSTGLTSSILSYEDHYHKRYNLHISEISEEQYKQYSGIDDKTYQDIVHTYMISCKYCGKVSIAENCFIPRIFIKYTVITAILQLALYAEKRLIAQNILNNSNVCLSFAVKNVAVNQES